MNLSLTDQVIVVLYLAVIMSIGFAMKRRAAKGMSSYFLGGRRFIAKPMLMITAR